MNSANAKEINENGRAEAARYLPAPVGYLPAPEGLGVAPPEGERHPVVHYLQVLTRRRGVFLLTWLLVVGTMGAYVYTQPRVYRAVATVQVQDQPQGMMAAASRSEDKEAALNTQAKIVQSGAVAWKAAERLVSIIPDPADARPGDQKQVAGWTPQTPWERTTDTEQQQQAKEQDLSPEARRRRIQEANEIRRSITVRVDAPDVLEIQSQHTNPERAMLIANAVQDAYIEQNRDLARSEAKSARVFLETQLPLLEKGVQRAEAAINAYRASHNVKPEDPREMAQAALVVQYDAEAERSRSELQAATAELESLRVRLATAPRTRRVTQMIADPVADGLRQEIAKAEVELAQALVQYDENHPRVRAVRAQITSLQQQFDQRFHGRPEVRTQEQEEPDPNYALLKDRVQDQETRVEMLRARASSLGAIASQRLREAPGIQQPLLGLARLEHAKDVSERVYTTVLQQLLDARLNEARQQGTAYAVDLADQPKSPIQPRIPSMMGLAVLLGLGLGLSVALLLETTDTTVRDPADLSARSGISPLGFILALRDPNPSPLIANRSPRGAIAEAYGMALTNLRSSFQNAAPRTLLVTSAAAGEGKSFASVGLAIVAAQGGAKVILVDADLRRPTLHQVFKREQHPGLTEVLNGEVPLSEALQPTDVENLQVLTSGALPSNPRALLNSRRMAELIEELKGQAELVCFDSPPALAVADAVLLSSRVDATVAVVAQGLVHIGALIEVRHMIEQAGGTFAGAVINKVRPQPGDYYYHYYRHNDYYSNKDEDRPTSAGRPSQDDVQPREALATASGPREEA